MVLYYFHIIIMIINISLLINYQFDIVHWRHDVNNRKISYILVFVSDSIIALLVLLFTNVS